MSKASVITVRIPEDLKTRIEKIAKNQGISMNKFALYALTKEAGELEANDFFKQFLKNKKKDDIYEAFNAAMLAVQERPVPDWDE